jgi:DNA-binding SARP family transcriptional activator
VVEFRLLGALEIVDGDRRLVPTASKPRQVLALLLLRHNQIVPTETLIKELWGGDPPRSARSTLQTYVYKLRKLLSGLSDGSGGSDGEGVLSTKPTGYMATINPSDIDVWRFEQLVEQGRGYLDEQPDLAAATFARALDLWRGPALADVMLGEVLPPHITFLTERRLVALELRIEAELSLGWHRERISELRQLIAEFPLHEGFHAQLMLALYRSDRRSEAHDVYRRFSHQIDDELGLEPGQALRQLHEALLSGEPSLRLRPQSAIRVSAVPHAVLPAQLPRDINDFVGRADLLDRIEQLLILQHGAYAGNLVQITGMPGIGKTALAVRVARRVKCHFPDGQFFGELADQESVPVGPREMLGAFLVSAGISPELIPDSVLERSKMFRSWTDQRRVLIMLDDAVSADQVIPLLPGSPHCQVLITARGRLAGLDDTCVVEVPRLSCEEGIALLGNIAGVRRVEREQAAARELVRLCGHHPLAIRAVGTRLVGAPAWSLAKMVTRLTEPSTRLAFISSPGMEVAASIESSFLALGQPDQHALPMLSMLPDAFTAELAARLLGIEVDQVEESLVRLVHSHLIEMSADGPDGTVSYRFHPLVRLWARAHFDGLISAGSLEEHVGRRWE